MRVRLSRQQLADVKAFIGMAKEEKLTAGAFDEAMRALLTELRHLRKDKALLDKAEGYLWPGVAWGVTPNHPPTRLMEGSGTVDQAWLKVCPTFREAIRQMSVDETDPLIAENRRKTISVEVKTHKLEDGTFAKITLEKYREPKPAEPKEEFSWYESVHNCGYEFFGWLREAANWRQYAVIRDGVIIKNVNCDWVKNVLKIDRAECIRRSRFCYEQAKKLRTSQ